MSYKYRIKATVDAIKYTGKAGQEPVLDKFVEGLAEITTELNGSNSFHVLSLEKHREVLHVGDYIVKRADACWICPGKVFDMSYELIKE